MPGAGGDGLRLGIEAGECCEGVEVAIDVSLARAGFLEDAWAKSPAELVSRSGSCRMPSAGRPGAPCHSGRGSMPTTVASLGLVVREVASARLAGKLPEPRVPQALVARTVMPWALAWRRRPR